MQLEWDPMDTVWKANGPHEARLRMMPLAAGKWANRMSFRDPELGPSFPKTAIGTRLDDRAMILDDALSNTVQEFCSYPVPEAVKEWLRGLGCSVTTTAPVTNTTDDEKGVTYVVQIFGRPDLRNPVDWYGLTKTLTLQEAEKIAKENLESDIPVRILREVVENCVAQYVPQTNKSE